jgi:hypothetical protein
MTIKIEEGQVSAVPLNKDIRALGVIARVDRKKGSRRKPYIVFAYFFGPYLEAPPLNQLVQLKARDAVLRLKCSILYIYDGKWQILGSIPTGIKRIGPCPYFFATTY